MALNVKFLAGSFESFQQITKDPNTFYLVSKVVEGVPVQDLYLGNVKLSNQPEIDAAIKSIKEVTGELKDLNTEAKNTLVAALNEVAKKASDNETHIGDVATLATTAKTDLVAAINEIFNTADNNSKFVGKAADLKTTAKDTLVAAVNEVSDKASANATAIGDVSTLETTATDLTSAINEVNTAVVNAKTAGAVTLKTVDSTEYAKVYKFYQGETKEDDAEFGLIGTINIPKDMVVESGAVEVDPEGQPEGTYLVLTLANATKDKIYINTTNLVDIYTAKAGATEVQLAVSETGEISATLVDDGIATAKLKDLVVTTAKIADTAVTTTKLADSAVTAAKIADGVISKAKLDKDLVDAIEDTSATLEGITTGTTDGTIKVGDRDVAVAGLGTMAYEDATDFDAKGSASTAETNAKAYTDAALSWGSFDPAPPVVEGE